VAEAEADFCLTPAYCEVAARECAAAAAAAATAVSAAPGPEGNGSEEGEPETGADLPWQWTGPQHATAGAIHYWAEAASRAVTNEGRNAACEVADTAEAAYQAAFLHDIFGQLIREPGGELCWLWFGGKVRRARLPLPRNVRVESTWLRWNDGAVRRIAEGIYEERAFDRLPILADALLDAGCDDEEPLAHCRSTGPHVRGCGAGDLG
jgi:hypothetical protein